MTRFSKATGATRQRSVFLIKIPLLRLAHVFHRKPGFFPQAEAGLPDVTVNL
ncbi:hypothetical protein SynPROSU1_02196 [Synechococcus sp. PROS-U-1]|nr:hypothetical protein SynPROSU1_02196 [Synechococcus sp. PROS-U-1]